MEKILKEGQLAIVMPVLDCLNYTKQFLPTIRTKHPYKLIIINNGSTDGTANFLDRLGKLEDVIIIHSKENIGCGPGWNYGIKYAIENFDSQFFFIPNNDILLHPEAIDTLIDCVSLPGVALASATDVAGQVVRAPDVLTLDLPKHGILKEAPDFSCFMLSRETIEEIGYFDEKFYPAYFEDNDYHYRINLAGLKGVSTNKALYFHYGSRTVKEGKEIKKTVNLAYLANRDYYIRKWGGKPGDEAFAFSFDKQK